VVQDARPGLRVFELALLHVCTYMCIRGACRRCFRRAAGIHQVRRCHEGVLGDHRTNTPRRGVSALLLSLHRLLLLLQGAPLALSAKPSMIRPQVIMHSTLTPTTSTPLKDDKARRRAGMAGAKVMLPTRVYKSTPTLSPPTHIDTYTEPPEAGRHLHRHLHGAPEARRRLHRCLQEPPRGRAPSTSTPTRTRRQGRMAFTSSLLRHPHQHHRHRPCADKAKPYSTDMSFSGEAN
jgi:hypothetical protein